MRRMQKILAMLCAAGLTVGGAISFLNPAAPVSSGTESSFLIESPDESSIIVSDIPDDSLPEDSVIEESSVEIEESSIIEVEAIDLSFATDTLSTLREDLLSTNYLTFYNYTFDPPAALSQLVEDHPDIDTFVLTETSVYPADSSDYDPENIRLILQVSDSFDPLQSEETPLSLRMMVADHFSDAPGNGVFLFAGGGEIIVLDGFFDETLSSEEAHYRHYVGSPTMWLLSEDATGKVHDGVFYGSVTSSYYNDWGEGTDADQMDLTPFGTITYDLNDQGRIDPSLVDIMPADMDSITAVQNGYRYKLDNGYLQVYIEPTEENEFPSFRFTPMDGSVSKVVFDTSSLSALLDLYR